MVRREELVGIATTIADTTAVDLGTTVADGMRRYIYWMKVVNEAAMANVLTMYQRQTGVATTLMDRWVFSVEDETQEWPSGGPKENSLPIYIMEASTKLRLKTATGSARFYAEYIDGI